MTLHKKMLPLTSLQFHHPPDSSYWLIHKLHLFNSGHHKWELHTRQNTIGIRNYEETNTPYWDLF